jgi:hypothetical protein
VLSDSGKVMFRLGVNCDGPAVCSGKPVLKPSNRIAPCTVIRPRFMRSWIYMPQSLRISLLIVYGVEYIVSWFGTPLLKRYARSVRRYWPLSRVAEQVVDAELDRVRAGHV